MASGFRSVALLELGGLSGIVPSFRSLALFELGGIGKPTSGTGNLNKTNLNDVLIAIGTPIIPGTLAKTNLNDTLSSFGSSGTNAKGFRDLALIEIGGIGFKYNLTGTVNYINIDDTLVSLGSAPTVIIEVGSTRLRPGRGPYSLGNYYRPSNEGYSFSIPGSMIKTNQNDTLSANGWSQLIIGTLARSNGTDVLSASGNILIDGTLAKINNNDVLSSSGGGTINGTLTKTNQNDTGVSYGLVGNPPAATSRLPLTGQGS